MQDESNASNGYVGHRPRFTVEALTGYTIKPGVWGAYGKTATTFWVCDRDYCHREVAISYPPIGGRIRPERRRAKMEAIAARLNAEHEAWLALDISPLCL